MTDLLTVLQIGSLFQSYLYLHSRKNFGTHRKEPYRYLKNDIWIANRPRHNIILPEDYHHGELLKIYSGRSIYPEIHQQ